MRSALETGASLYADGEYVLAARRFRDAAEGAAGCGDLRTERRARAAECAAWLRAERRERFGGCTAELERVQARLGRSDPGTNTLLALGAIAADRPLPPFRLPGSVRPILRSAAGEERR